MYTRERAIKDHEAEVSYLKKLKESGRETVEASCWAIGTPRKGNMPIDEAIALWESRLAAVKDPSSNPEDYNY